MDSLFVYAFCLSALAGLASLLRGKSELTAASVLSSVLNSGLLGVAICLLWYSQFRDNLYFLVGAAVMAGLAGTPGVEFVLSLVRKLVTTRAGVSDDGKKEGGDEKPG